MFELGEIMLVSAFEVSSFGHDMFIPLATEAEADLLRITLLLLGSVGLDLHVLGHVGGV